MKELFNGTIRKSPRLANKRETDFFFRAEDFLFLSSASGVLERALYTRGVPYVPV